MENIWKPNKFFINWSGYWPEFAWTIKQKIACFINLFLNFVFIILPEIYFIYKNFGDMIEVSQCLSEMLSILLAFIKMLLMLHYREKVNKLINDMANQWNQNSSFTPNEWTEVRIFTEKQTKILTYAYIITYVGFGTNFMINPIIVSIIKAKLNNEPITPGILPTPIKLEFPYDTVNSMINWIICNSVSTIATFTTILILASFDAFYLSLMNYTGIFFKFVNVELKNIKTILDESEKKNWSKERTKELMKELAEIVKHHETALDYVERLEEISNVYMLTQYLLSTFLFCMVGFQLTLVCCLNFFFFLNKKINKQYLLQLMQNLYQFFRIATYCLCLIMQLLTFSYFGSKLMDESGFVAVAAYDCDWYDKPVVFQKSISLIIMRSQRPSGVSAAKFYLISLESFSKVK